MRGLFALVILALSVVPAAAAQQIGAYYAEIGAEDRSNSRGVPLTDLGAVLQQDRANFHRFGIRHGGDDPDPFFADRQNRAAIPALYNRGPRERVIEEIIGEGHSLGIFVVVCGSGGTPEYLVVNFADGDRYNGCD